MYNIATAIGTGLGIGIITMLLSAFVFIPASYVMNKYIYHAPAMRVILGILAGSTWFLSFLVILVMRMGGIEKCFWCAHRFIGMETNIF